MEILMIVKQKILINQGIQLLCIIILKIQKHPMLTVLVYMYVDGGKDIYLFGNTVIDSIFGIEIGAEETKHKNYVTNIIVENNKLEGNTITGIRVGGYKKSRLNVKNTVFRKNKITKSNTSI